MRNPFRFRKTEARAKADHSRPEDGMKVEISTNPFKDKTRRGFCRVDTTTTAETVWSWDLTTGAQWPFPNGPIRGREVIGTLEQVRDDVTKALLAAGWETRGEWAVSHDSSDNQFPTVTTQTCWVWRVAPTRESIAMTVHATTGWWRIEYINDGTNDPIYPVEGGWVEDTGWLLNQYQEQATETLCALNGLVFRGFSLDWAPGSTWITTGNPDEYHREVVRV